MGWGGGGREGELRDPPTQILANPGDPKMSHPLWGRGGLLGHTHQPPNLTERQSMDKFFFRAFGAVSNPSK